jgi:hypothetical protein
MKIELSEVKTIGSGIIRFGGVMALDDDKTFINEVIIWPFPESR